MGYEATRGICIGVGKHLAKDEPAPSDLDAGTVTFLVGIGALRFVADKAEPQPIEAPKTDELDLKPTPEKSGKKEK